MKHWLKRAFLLIIISGVAACGGSGGSSTTTPPVNQNTSPIANGGIDQAINTGAVVSLDGSASSDANGDTLTYQWTITTVPAGSNAELSDATNTAPSFTADIDGSYIIQLIVNDGTVNSAADSVTVVATTPNTAPIANAGAFQSVDTGTLVTLSGTASTDAENDTLTYSWSITSSPSGSVASLSDATAASPTFTADVDGNYVAQLIVNDGALDSAADSTTVTATAPNTAPVSNAGIDQNISTGMLVSLNGTASSDSDGDSLTYLWTLTSPTGSSASLNNATLPSPTFTADVDGNYTAQLVVNDGVANSASDSVTIVATTLNSAPIANAGADQNKNTGSLVTLDGSASTDADADLLTYQWVLTSIPATSTATLNDATLASPTFSVDIDGNYVAELTVNDGTVDSASDSVTIVASTANSAPTADAGSDQNVLINTLVTLDGSSSSDADGDAITYQWSFSSVPSGSASTIQNATTSAPSFTPDTAGTYTAQLIVNDGQAASTADTVNIVVTVVNSAPVANAGDDQLVTTATQVMLDGSGSTDANGDSLTYTWSFVSVPSGSLSVFDDSQAVNPSFTTDAEGSYIISLVVSDGTVSSAADTLQVRVSDTTVSMFQKIGAFGNTFNEIAFPYSNTITMNANVSGSPRPATFTLDTFRLIAHGGDLTITNIVVVNETNNLAASIGTISEGFVLPDGVTIEFEIISELTNNEPVELRYSFEIKETGQTFFASYRLTTN